MILTSLAVSQGCKFGALIFNHAYGRAFAQLNERLVKDAFLGAVMRHCGPSNKTPLRLARRPSKPSMLRLVPDENVNVYEADDSMVGADGRGVQGNEEAENCNEDPSGLREAAQK